MSEKIVSPGVFSKEIDQSFLPAALGNIGAAIIGPTVKGKAMVPTVVSSYSEFVSKFGNTFKSGSSYYQYLTSHAAENYLRSGNRLTVVRILEGSFTAATASICGKDGKESLQLTTLSHGQVMNSNMATPADAAANTQMGAKGLLLSGSNDNLRWEINSHNYKKGTFSLNIRRGNDIEKRKQVLESWSNITLDPNSPNYIAKRIGDQELVFREDENSNPYIDYTGSFSNKSKYVRVEVKRATVDYLDENGTIRITGSEAYIPPSDCDSQTGVCQAANKSAAILTDAIDTTGAEGADAFIMTVPTAAGGDNVAHKIEFVANDAAVDAISDTNAWGIAITTANTDALKADAIIDAINGTVNSAVGYGGGAVGTVLAAGTVGLTAAEGTTSTDITLTMDDGGTVGNVAGVLSRDTGFELALLVTTTFTGGGEASTNHKNGQSGSYGGGFLGGADGDVKQAIDAQNFYKDITGDNMQGFNLSSAGSAGSLEYIKAIKLLQNEKFRC